jgi:hypothetical protein
VPAPGEPLVVTVDLAGVPLDLGVVDALARLQLAVGRLGGRVRLAQGGPDLGALLRLCGLDDVLRSTEPGA